MKNRHSRPSGSTMKGHTTSSELITLWYTLWVRRPFKVSMMYSNAAPPSIVTKPLTFSNMKTRGLRAWITSTMCWNTLLRLSANPACAPAPLNGWHGKPATYRSMSGTRRISRDTTSRNRRRTDGKFARIHARASGFKSEANACVMLRYPNLPEGTYNGHAPHSHDM